MLPGMTIGLPSTGHMKREESVATTKERVQEGPRGNLLIRFPVSTGFTTPAQMSPQISTLSPFLPWKCETPLLPQIPADLTHDSAAFGGKEVALQRSPAKGKFTRRPGLDHIWPGACLFNLGVKKEGLLHF